MDKMDQKPCTLGFPFSRYHSWHFKVLLILRTVSSFRDESSPTLGSRGRTRPPSPPDRSGDHGAGSWPPLVCSCVTRSGSPRSRAVETVNKAGWSGEVRRPWGFSREARRGSQGASRSAPGKSGLPARGEGERVLALEYGKTTVFVGGHVSLMFCAP